MIRCCNHVSKKRRVPKYWSHRPHGGTTEWSHVRFLQTCTGHHKGFQNKRCKNIYLNLVTVEVHNIDIIGHNTDIEQGLQKTHILPFTIFSCMNIKHDLYVIAVILRVTWPKFGMTGCWYFHLGAIAPLNMQSWRKY